MRTWSRLNRTLFPMFCEQLFMETGLAQSSLHSNHRARSALATIIHLAVVLDASAVLAASVPICRPICRSNIEMAPEVITYLVRGRSACCQAQALEAAQADQQSAATEVAVVSGAWPASAASRCTARTNPQQELRTLQHWDLPVVQILRTWRLKHCDADSRALPSAA
jgi:hypothetical protein